MKLWSTIFGNLNVVPWNQSLKKTRPSSKPRGGLSCLNQIVKYVVNWPQTKNFADKEWITQDWFLWYNEEKKQKKTFYSLCHAF